MRHCLYTSQSCLFVGRFNCFEPLWCSLNYLHNLFVFIGQIVLETQCRFVILANRNVFFCVVALYICIFRRFYIIGNTLLYSLSSLIVYLPNGLSENLV